MTTTRLTQPVHDAITVFVRYATELGEKAPYEFLPICDLLLAAYHSCPDLCDDLDWPKPPDLEYSEIRSEVQRAFPDYGLYNLPEHALTHIAESGVMVGDALDDITDIVRDFRRILWCYDHTSEADAVWHFRIGYMSHWARHVRDLQFYLIRLEEGD
jgi:hypothetical protein